jgi:hypothetical protein
LALKRATDITELGEKLVRKKSRFETCFHQRIKELAKENPKLSIRHFGVKLKEEFPGKAIP